jgi:hypothetical protein
MPFVVVEMKKFTLKITDFGLVKISVFVKIVYLCKSCHENKKNCRIQCCGSYFSMSSGSGSHFQKVPVSDPTFSLTKYDFKDPKMAFQNIIFKEYLNLIYKNGQNYEITPFYGFC